MKKIFGSIAIFISTFLLLSINLKDKPAFSHIYHYSAPLTQSLQRQIEYVVKFGIDGSKAFGEKIFHNSIPKQKTLDVSNKITEPLENISEKDQEALNDLIKE